MRPALASAALLALTLPAAAQEAPERPTPASIVAAAPAEDWKPIEPEDLLVMTLAPDQHGNPRVVVIQLIPPPFSQPWVENIRMLARAHWWDGTSVYRVQDNYVAQWGDATEAKPLPEGVVSPVASYEVQAGPDRPIGTVELERDSYAETTGFENGWPVAASKDLRSAWPVHCYGYVGVGRDLAPDTGTAAELYTIIGQPQRHMDRNLAVVGRVIEGMEHLSSLPRGHGELGFYAEHELHLRTPIVSVRLANELPDPPRFEYLDTASESFARYVAVRANRNDAFYTVPAGGVDVCSLQVPIRRSTGSR